PVVFGSTYHLFYDSTKLEHIYNIEYLDMSNVKNAEGMFAYCYALQELDLSSFDTHNLENTNIMFHSCIALQELDLSSWSTPNLKQVYAMFYNCAKLKRLDISGLNLSNCTWAASFVESYSDFVITISDSVAACPLKPLSPFGTLYDEEGETYNVASETLPKGGTYYTTRPHIHQWVLTSTLTEATCENDGSGRYECQKADCPTKSKIDVIPATGHKYTTYVYDNNAKCTEDGTETAQCNNGCGKTDQRTKANSKLNHDFAGAPWVNTDPTNHWHVCKRQDCDETDTPVAHTFNWVEDTPATFISEGEKHEECTSCHFTKNEGTPIPKLTCNHSNTTHTAAVAATCVSTGNVEYWHCNDCGKDLDASSAVIMNTTTAIDPNNHSFTNYVSNNDVTCTKDGTKTAQCDYGCNKTDRIEDKGSARGHNYEAVEGGVAPTCTQPGNGKVKCTRCQDEKVGDSIPALGHIEVTDEAKAATCTETGLTEGKHCSRCEEVLIAQTEIPALGHTEITDEAKGPTCTATGLTAGAHCSVCNTVITEQEEIPALGHNYEWEITEQPTKDETGLKQNKCTVCGDIDGEEVIAKLVSDEGGKGDVVDLPPDKEYDLDIEVRETNESYSLEGINKGYAVKLWV
ncbi:MAG: DUF285 domain-containing protein, partial [Clostridia bacterium]|nr:DUF285 domain-containing protein [Clostridia bacterium]